MSKLMISCPNCERKFSSKKNFEYHVTNRVFEKNKHICDKCNLGWEQSLHSGETWMLAEAKENQNYDALPSDEAPLEMGGEHIEVKNYLGIGVQLFVNDSQQLYVAANTHVKFPVSGGEMFLTARAETDDDGTQAIIFLNRPFQNNSLINILPRHLANNKSVLA